MAQRQAGKEIAVPLSLKSKSTTYADREQWLVGRGKGIGASDAPIVLGESTWDSAYGLWAKKRGMVPFDASESIAIKIGQGMEAVAANIYEDYTRRECYDLGAFTVQRHPIYPFLTCTLDRVVHDFDKGWGCLNLKAVGGAKSEEWVDSAPRIYWVQEQAEMMVTGLKWASLGVIVSNYDFRWCDVERDDDFIDNTLIPKLCRFWAHVQTGIPPTPDGHPSTGKAIGSAHPLEDGSTIALPGEFYDLDLELLETKRDIDRLCYRKSEIENLIKATMGESSYGLIPGVARYSWNVQGTAGGGFSRVLRRKAV